MSSWSGDEGTFLFLISYASLATSQPLADVIQSTIVLKLDLYLSLPSSLAGGAAAAGSRITQHRSSLARVHESVPLTLWT